jgi:hypothetical protein
VKVEHRRDKRSRVFLTAVLRSADGEVEVKLSNLSTIGACAHYPIILAPATEVQLSRGDLLIPARIAWSADGRIGIEFREPIDVEAFRTQGHASDRFQAAPLHKPAERLSRRMEQHWADIWKS